MMLIPLSLMGQEYFFFEQRTIDGIKEIERQFKSRKLKTQKVYLSSAIYPYADKYEVEFPISYLRLGDTLISSCMVEYYYTKPDSKIRLVMYEWDETQKTDFLTIQSEIMKTERLRFKEYNEKYDQLLNIISNKMGTPFSDSKLKSIVTGNSAYNERNTKWKKETITVEQNLIFTTSDNELGTYRIRVAIYWD